MYNQIDNFPQADVIVYGDTSGGVAAAVQAARMGKSVILVSPYGHLGGMTSSGLGWTDIGNSAILGGISREFYHRVYLHYQQAEAWVQQQKEDFPEKAQQALSFDPEKELACVFEPKVAEQIFDDLIREAGVTVINGRLNLKAGATLEGKRITAIRLEDGQTIKGSMFIDASYEGDLLEEAGVTFVVGRESNRHYNEQSNAITLPVHGNNLMDGIDPYRVPGDPHSGLLPGVNEYDETQEGQADHRLQSYCYRTVMTNAPENRAPFEKPATYDEADYEILFRSIEAGYTGQFGNFFKFSPMPNRKTDSNNCGGVSMDFIGGNYSPLPPDHPDYWDWTTLSHAEREEVAAKHRDWQLGLIWSLQHHPRVPEEMREKYRPWGLPKDEFPDNNHWPIHLYVREGRRMVSDVVMTEAHCRNETAVDDPVGMGAYQMDSHNTQRVVYKGMLKNEGDIQRSLGCEPYAISYKATVPKKGECENLLVAWCLSASHIAFGSIRMEPVGMILGQSTATAGCMAMDLNCPVQDLPYDALKTKLIEGDQRLSV